MRRLSWGLAVVLALAVVAGPATSAGAQSPSSPAVVGSAARGSAASGSAATGSAGQIVYVCGANLCTVDPSTARSAQLTTDGREYTSPSVSADGTRMAAAIGWQAVAGPYGSNLPEVWEDSQQGLTDVAISPDGKALSTSYWYSQLLFVWCGPYIGGCLQTFIYDGNTYYSAPAVEPVDHSGGSGTAFLGGSVLSVGEEDGTWVDANGNYVSERHFVCSYDSPGVAESPCTPKVYEYSPQNGLEVNFHSPAGSPDGKLIAAVLSSDDDDDNPANDVDSVVVYDAATGARVATMPGYGFTPAFSPDSTRLVWQAVDGWLYTAPARGGSATKLVQGTEPTWANVAAGTSTPPGTGGTATLVRPRKPLTVKRGALTLKIACPATAAASCKGTVRLTAARSKGKKKPVALTRSTSFTVSPGRTGSVKVKLTGKGAKLLRSARVTKAAVVLKAGGSTSSVKVKIRRP